MALKINRPQPSATQTFTWMWHAHRHECSVQASYAADMQAVPNGPEPDSPALPNHVLIKSGPSSESYTHEIRLTRTAAEQLVAALTDVLAWDGA